MQRWRDSFSVSGMGEEGRRENEGCKAREVAGDMGGCGSREVEGEDAWQTRVGVGVGCGGGALGDKLRWHIGWGLEEAGCTGRRSQRSHISIAAPYSSSESIKFGGRKLENLQVFGIYILVIELRELVKRDFSWPRYTVISSDYYSSYLGSEMKSQAPNVISRLPVPYF